MAYQPNGYTQGPSEQELRQRAANRVARRRAFTTSLVVVGSLIVLNLYLYSQSRNSVFLILDAVFVCTLSYRAWVAFGTERTDEARIQQEMSRMRPAAQPGAWPQQQAAPTNWQQPIPPSPAAQAPAAPPPVPPPPPPDAANWS